MTIPPELVLKPNPKIITENKAVFNRSNLKKGSRLDLYCSLKWIFIAALGNWEMHYAIGVLWDRLLTQSNYSDQERALQNYYNCIQVSYNFYAGFHLALFQS